MNEHEAVLKSYALEEPNGSVSEIAVSVEEIPEATKLTGFYAGIGSRETPPEICHLMKLIGRQLALNGMTLRSGGSGNADLAFESGCDEVNGKKEIFIPWASFAGKGIVPSSLADAMLMVQDVIEPSHWNNMGDGAKKLHARNVNQIFGDDLSTPDNKVDFVICWTPEGKEVGGTATALKIANMLTAEGYNTPIFNLAIKEVREEFLRELGITSLVIVPEPEPVPAKKVISVPEFVKPARLAPIEKVVISGKPVQMVFPLKMHSLSNPLPVSTTIDAMRGYGRTHTTRTYEPYKAYEFKKGDVAIAVAGDKKVAFRVGDQYIISQEMINDPTFQQQWADKEKHSPEELAIFIGKPEVWGLHMEPLGDYVKGNIVPFPTLESEVPSKTTGVVIKVVDSKELGNFNPAEIKALRPKVIIGATQKKAVQRYQFDLFSDLMKGKNSQLAELLKPYALIAKDNNLVVFAAEEDKEWIGFLVDAIEKMADGLICV